MPKRKVNLIVIHCTATKETQDYTFQQLIRDHQNRGFVTCGYHRFIRKDGTVLIGRHFDKAGAHVKDYNANSIGISYEGGCDAAGKPKDTRTPAQKKSIAKCINEALAYAEGGVERVLGHRDLSPDTNGNGLVEPHEWVKQCPCFNASAEYNKHYNEV